MSALFLCLFSLLYVIVSLPSYHNILLNWGDNRYTKVGSPSVEFKELPSPYRPNPDDIQDLSSALDGHSLIASCQGETFSAVLAAPLTRPTQAQKLFTWGHPIFAGVGAVESTSYAQLVYDVSSDSLSELTNLACGRFVVGFILRKTDQSHPSSAYVMGRCDASSLGVASAGGLCDSSQLEIRSPVLFYVDSITLTDVVSLDFGLGVTVLGRSDGRILTLGSNTPALCTLDSSTYTHDRLTLLPLGAEQDLNYTHAHYPSTGFKTSNLTQVVVSGFSGFGFYSQSDGFDGNGKGSLVGWGPGSQTLQEDASTVYDCTSDSGPRRLAFEVKPVVGNEAEWGENYTYEIASISCSKAYFGCALHIWVTNTDTGVVTGRVLGWAQGNYAAGRGCTGTACYEIEEVSMLEGNNISQVAVGSTLVEYYFYALADIEELNYRYSVVFAWGSRGREYGIMWLCAGGSCSGKFLPTDVWYSDDDFSSFDAILMAPSMGGPSILVRANRCFNHLDGPACSGIGTCLGNDVCDCTGTNALGDECETFECFGYDKDSPEVCNYGNGTCRYPDNCDCGVYGSTMWSGSECKTPVTCNGIPFNDPNVCSGHGTCNFYAGTVGKCVCDTGSHSPNTFCSSHAICDGKYYWDPLVCGECGTCYWGGSCSCPWVGDVWMADGAYCQFPKFCYGVEFFRDSVCSGHGQCINVDQCSCQDGYDPSTIPTPCARPFCYDKSDESLVCGGGQGICISPDVCICHRNESYGVECQETILSAVMSLESNRLFLKYRILDSFVPRTMKQGKSFACWRVLAESDDLHDGGLTCSFDFQSGGAVATGLNVVTKDGRPFSGLEVGDSLALKIVSEPDHLPIHIDIQLEVRNATAPVDIEGADVGAAVGYTFLVLFLLSIIVAGCIGAGCYIYYGYQKRAKTQQNRLDRLEKLQGFDVLVKEQEVMSQEGKQGVIDVKIDRSLFAVDFDDIELIRKLGAGASGSTVFLARWQNLEVAFKQFQTDELLSSQDRYNDFEKELSMLANLRHPNIVEFLGASIKPPRLGLLMEFCTKGDIKTCLTVAAASNTPWNLEQRIQFCIEVCFACSYLHRCNIIHRDLKCENVLVTERDEARVMDFGLSKTMERITQTMTVRVGTCIYMAPEVTCGEKYDQKCDVFSFGIMLYEILTDDFTPYGEEFEFNVEFRVAQDPTFRPTIPIFIPPHIHPVMRKCWAHDPLERPTFKEAIVSLAGIKKMVTTEQAGKRASRMYYQGMGGGQQSVFGDAPPKLPGQVEDDLVDTDEIRSERTRLLKKLDGLKAEHVRLSAWSEYYDSLFEGDDDVV